MMSLSHDWIAFTLLVTELIQGIAISQQCATSPSVVYLLVEPPEPAGLAPVELGFAWFGLGATLADCKA